MKKLLFGVCSLFLLVVSGAEPLAINGNFNSDGIMPDGWEMNRTSWFKPFGKLELLKGERSGNLVKITASPEKPANLCHTAFFPVKDGDRIDFSAWTQGRGKGGIGVYFFDHAQNWIANSIKCMPLNAEGGEIKGRIYIFNVKNRPATAFVRLVIAAERNSEIKVGNLKAIPFYK